MESSSNRAALAALIALAATVGCGRIGFDSESRNVADSGAGTPDVASADSAMRVDIRGPGSWQETSASPLAARAWTSAVWTGTEFLTFAGSLDVDYTPTDTGARFNPVTREWTPLSMVDAASRRHTPLLVWNGTEVLVYAGGFGLGPIAGGGRYNPAADEWSPMSTTGQPELRIYGEGLWVGDAMLVWGGWANAPGHYQSGYLYDPDNDSWSSMSTTGAPTGRSFASSLFTGIEVIVWGGCEGPMGSCPDQLGDGAIYTPSTDSWRPMSSVGAPSARSQHTAVWTGTEMILFGGATAGNGGGVVNTGAIYNPGTDSWRPITTDGAPSPRADCAGAWVGNKMLIWGGLGQSENDGFLYDPVDDKWSPMSTVGGPTGRVRFAYAASDSQLFIWGGSYNEESGAVWTPEP